MIEVHDKKIINFMVNIDDENSFLKLVLKKDDIVEELIFDNFLLNSFTNFNNYQNVLSTIKEGDINKFLKLNQAFLEESLNYGSPRYLDSISELEEFLKNNDYKVYFLSASFGLNGWILAKDMTIQVVG